MNPYLNIDRLKKDLYIAILNEIQHYKSFICQDYVYGKIQGILDFACEVGIISYSGRFAIEDFIDRKLKYLDRGGII